MTISRFHSSVMYSRRYKHAFVMLPTVVIVHRRLSKEICEIIPSMRTDGAFYARDPFGGTFRKSTATILYEPGQALTTAPHSCREHQGRSKRGGRTCIENDSSEMRGSIFAEPVPSVHDRDGSMALNQQPCICHRVHEFSPNNRYDLRSQMRS